MGVTDHSSFLLPTFFLLLTSYLLPPASYLLPLTSFLLTMRIGINASFLRKPSTGIGQVSTHFLRTLIANYQMNRIFAEHTFVLYLQEDIDWELPENFEKRVVLPFWKRDDLARAWMWESRVLPREVERDGCEALFSLTQSATVIRDRRVRHVMLVHDIIPRLFPEYLDTWRKRAYQRAIEEGVRHADRILTVSKHTEKDLVRHLGIDASRIGVAYIDVDPIFSRPIPPRDKARVLAKYRLEEGYMYYGGGLETRKNIHALLVAYRKLLKERTRFSDKKTVIPDLVISGALFPQLAPLITDVEEEVKKMNLTNYVHILGRVPQEDLPALYGSARLFVYPSRYEGFGMPVLEAMRVGTPVVASKHSSLPEVAGDASVYCDPDVPESIAQTLLTVLGREDVRYEMVRRGYERAKRFSWKTFTEKVMRVIESV